MNEAIQPRLMKPLTSIRGVMALWVVFYHVYHHHPSLREAIGVFAPILSRGYLAVDFFFLLSGFILCYVYQSKFCGLNKVFSSFKPFLLARFARIYPMHLFILLVLILLEWGKVFHIIPMYDGNAPFHHEKSLSKLALNFFLIQSWPFFPRVESWNNVAWSISVEWFAYFIFPFTYLIMRNKKRFSLLLFIGLLVAFEFMYCLSNPNSSFEYCFTVFRCLPAFLSGMILYTLSQQKNIENKNIFKSDWISLIAIALLLFLIQVGVRDPYIIVSMGILLFCIAQNKRIIQTILSAAPLFWLGEISFSIYIIHLFLYPYWVILLVKLMWGNAWQLHHYTNSEILFIGASFIPVLLLISWLTYQWIEKPFRDRIRAFHFKPFKE